MTLIVCRCFSLYLLILDMEQEFTLPAKPGEICKIVNPLEDENPEDVYIVSEDPAPFDIGDNIYVTSLKELQRNISNPTFTPQIAISKGELLVVAPDLETYIAQWNTEK
jgi:hypothetical protein